MANDISTLQGQMKERLRDKMGGMVPEEIWDTMIDAEFNHLFRELVNVTDPVTAQKEVVTRFQFMIREELVAFGKEAAKKLAAEACNTKYDALTGEHKSEIIANAVQMNIQNLVAEALGGIFQRITFDAAQRARNGY